MIKVLKSFINFGLILFFIIIFSGQAKAQVNAPTITKVFFLEGLTLAGTTPAGSEVLIYLDGILVGQAETVVWEDCAKITSFCSSKWQWRYQPSQKLSDGSHLIMAVARDRASQALSAPTQDIKFSVNTVSAPTLASPSERTATADLRPVVAGLTRDKTRVKIYIDGALIGQTEMLTNDSGTANFNYRPALNLSRGRHSIALAAEDSAGNTSLSQTKNFIIELPLPAATMLKPVVNLNTISGRPFIVGLAKNNSKIKIYIDKKYNGELTVKNHPSGTANFAYKPFASLTRGGHSVYTIAVDKRGKVSILSNIIEFRVKNLAIAESAEEERKGVAAKISEPKSPASAKSITISQDSGLVADIAKDDQEKSQAKTKVEPAKTNLEKKTQTIKEDLLAKEQAALTKIKNLTGVNQEKSKNFGGMINESKETQGKLKLGVVLFILFLLGVVGWLLWVNKELIKEQRAKNQSPENGGKNKPSNGQNKLL